MLTFVLATTLPSVKSSGTDEQYNASPGDGQEKQMHLEGVREFEHGVGARNGKHHDWVGYGSHVKVRRVTESLRKST